MPYSSVGGNFWYAKRYAITKGDLEKVLATKLEDLPLLINEYKDIEGLIKVIKFRLDKQI